MTQDSTAAATHAPAAAARGGIYFGWWIVAGAIVAQFVAVALQAQISGVFLRPMTEELGWSRTEFTLATTAGTVLMGLLGFFVGAMVDRRGARPLMLVGLTIVGGSLMALSRIEELWQFILLRGVVFTTGNVLIGNLVVNVTISKWFVQRRGWAISMGSLGVSAAAIVTPVLMVPIVDNIGWRDGWILLGLAAWVLVYPVAMVMRRQPEDYGWLPDGKRLGAETSEQDRRAIEEAQRDFANSYTRGEAVRTGALWLLIFGFGAAGIGMMALFVHFIPFLTDAGFTRSQASLLVGTQGVSALLSKFAWGWAMQRYFPRGLAALSFLISAAATVGFVIGAQAGQLAPMYVLFFIWGIGVGGMIPISELIWASYYGRRHLGAVRGVGMPFTIIFFAGGPIFAAGYYDAIGSYDGAILTFAAFWLLAVLLVLAARRPAPREQAREATAAPSRPPAPAPPLPAAAATATLAGPARETAPLASPPPAPPPPGVATPLMRNGSNRDRGYMGEPKVAVGPRGHDYMRLALPAGRPIVEAEAMRESAAPRTPRRAPRDYVAAVAAPAPAGPPAAPAPVAAAADADRGAERPPRRSRAGQSARAAPPARATVTAPVPRSRPAGGLPSVNLGHARRRLQRSIPRAVERYAQDGTASAVAIGVAASVVATATIWWLSRGGQRAGSG